MIDGAILWKYLKEFWKKNNAKNFLSDDKTATSKIFLLKLINEFLSLNIFC